MGKYKVLKELVLNGSTLKADSIVELRGVHEKLKSIKDNVEKVPNETPLTVGTAAEVSVLGGIVPGTPLTPEQKEKLAAENAAETKLANQLAAEHIARDVAERGHDKPVATAVADSVLAKLQTNDFKKSEGALAEPPAEQK